jgi:RNA polymerase sigma-70 factor (ECF subfamily)
MVAALTRRLGVRHLDVIEDAIQAALLRALERWPGGQVPHRPEGWLLRVAFNLAVDALRRETRLDTLPEGRDGELDCPSSAVDDELALIFLCCNPSLSRAAQVGLTLKIACGLTPR